MEWIENILFYTALYVLLWNAYFLTVNKGIPNIRTAPAVRKKMAEIITEEMSSKGKETYTIIDMGAGNGDLTRFLARTLPHAKVIGIEIDKIAFWKCCFYKRFGQYKNLEYWNKNFHDADIRQADVITMFLLGTLMTSIRATLEQKLNEGTLVISNKFPIGGTWEPKNVIDIQTLYLHQKSLYVYNFNKGNRVNESELPSKDRHTSTVHQGK